MRIDLYKTAAEAACAAAELIAKQLYKTPNSVLGLATGGTMEPVYRCLIERHIQKRLSLRHATTFNLDEYIGLAPTHPASYQATMHRLLFQYTDIDPNRIHLPDGMALNPENEAERYERAIAKTGGIDLQLLGMGSNGHIAFNEPGTSFASRTHVVDLDNSTRAANARFFPKNECVPKQAITMGIRTILESREILLVVTGAAKRTALSEALLGEVNPKCPASALQLHANVTVCADYTAAVDITPLHAEFDEICSRIDASNIRFH